MFHASSPRRAKARLDSCRSGSIAWRRLQPGILLYETDAEGEVYLAVDEGVLVKTGPDVLVSVRRALGGTDLGQLRAAVEQEFLTLDEQEQSVRSVLAKMESDFIRRLAALRNE